MLTGRKLLLADDSLTIQKVVALTFDDEEMEVVAVGSGAQAIEKLNESLPDIVLADVFMPEPNGYQLCERIKRDGRTRHIPVVLLVGTFEPFNEAEARRVGADEVLTKPFQSIRELVNKVGGLLGGGHADEKSTDADRDADETTKDLPPVHTDAHAADASHATGQAASSPPADAFGDFDLDDATIQSVPAEQFDAHVPAAADAAVFSEVNEEEQFSDRAETEEAFVLTDESPAANAAASMQAQTTAAASVDAPARMQTSFATHAASAAEADDALLELGDIAPSSHAAAADDDDDFILDIGDEELSDFSTAAAVSEPASAAVAFAPQPAAEEDLSFAESAQLFEETQAVAEPQPPEVPQTFEVSQTPEVAEMPEAVGTTDAPEMFEPPQLLVETAPPAEGESEAEQHQDAEAHAP
ncbi:MAG TPA: response regulator, partial [Pyrinomonadaceae bacterium]|nr:response regulator [Pyrinomonadaceae bacterium]